MTIVQSGLAKDTTDFSALVRSSKQYQTLSKLVTEAGFQPQLDQADIFQVDRNGTANTDNGTGMTIPTQNTTEKSAATELWAFQPDNANELELGAVVKVHGARAAELYTNNELVETDPGYTTTHGTSNSGYKTTYRTSLQPAGLGDFIPDDPIPDDPIPDDPIPDNPIPDDPIPDNPIDDAIDGGKKIVGGAEDVWTETASFVANNSKVESAVDLGEDAFEFGVDVISPVDGDKPPQGLRDWAQRHNYEHVATVDLLKSCAYISVAAWIGATGLTITSLGVGAISYTIPAGITGACAVISMVDAWVSDTNFCSPTNLYVFMPQNPGPADSLASTTPLVIPFC